MTTRFSAILLRWALGFAMVAILYHFYIHPMLIGALNSALGTVPSQTQVPGIDPQAIMRQVSAPALTSQSWLP